MIASAHAARQYRIQNFPVRPIQCSYWKGLRDGLSMRLRASLEWRSFIELLSVDVMGWS